MRTIVVFIVLALACPAWPEIVTRLDTTNRVVALTFDACETKAPAFFDGALVRYLTNNKIPFTVFVSGKFALRNAVDLKALSSLPFVEIENHSLNHRTRMTNMSLPVLAREVASNGRLLGRITGREPRFFRFPYDRSNPRIVAAVESMGYRAVGFEFASGDPDRTLSGDRILAWVLRMTRPGSILIFHMNGRGWRTAEIMPRLTGALRKRGYSFVRLDEGVGGGKEPGVRP
jgi:peptidoglycan/xylan/chitin deacetylase (PgdA/CDA1 family)